MLCSAMLWYAMPLYGMVRIVPGDQISPWIQAGEAYQGSGLSIPSKRKDFHCLDIFRKGQGHEHDNAKKWHPSEDGYFSTSMTSLYSSLAR